jgi:hypothetical protein
LEPLAPLESVAPSEPVAPILAADLRNPKF